MARQHRDHSGNASQRQLRVGEIVRRAVADMLARGRCTIRCSQAT
jgi:hypothetical protein